MMKALLILLALEVLVFAALGCNDATKTHASPEDIHEVDDYIAVPYTSSLVVLHDDKRHVTCWVAVRSSSAGISCIPDAQVAP